MITAVVERSADVAFPKGSTKTCRCAHSNGAEPPYPRLSNGQSKVAPRLRYLLFLSGLHKEEFLDRAGGRGTGLTERREACRSALLSRRGR